MQLWMCYADKSTVWRVQMHCALGVLPAVLLVSFIASLHIWQKMPTEICTKDLTLDLGDFDSSSSGAGRAKMTFSPALPDLGLRSWTLYNFSGDVCLWEAYCRAANLLSLIFYSQRSPLFLEGHVCYNLNFVKWNYVGPCVGWEI